MSAAVHNARVDVILVEWNTRWNRSHPIKFPGFAANTPEVRRRPGSRSSPTSNRPHRQSDHALADALVPCMEHSVDLERTVWRELDALLADGNPGATRTFLISLEAAYSGAIAAPGVPCTAHRGPV